MQHHILVPSGVQTTRLAIPSNQWVELGLIDIGSVVNLKLESQNGNQEFFQQFENVPLDGHILALNYGDVTDDQDFTLIGFDNVQAAVCEIFLLVESYTTPTVDLTVTNIAVGGAGFVLSPTLQNAVFVPPDPDDPVDPNIEAFRLAAYNTLKY
jgi:hypothetical protein